MRLSDRMRVKIICIEMLILFSITIITAICYPIPYLHEQQYSADCVGFSTDGKYMASGGGVGWLKVHQLTSTGFMEIASLASVGSCSKIMINNDGTRIVALISNVKYFQRVAGTMTLIQTITKNRLSANEGVRYLVAANYFSPYQVEIYQWTSSTNPPYVLTTSINFGSDVTQVKISKAGDKLIVRSSGLFKTYDFDGVSLTLTYTQPSICTALLGPFSMDASSDLSTLVFGCFNGVAIYAHTSDGYKLVQNLHNNVLSGTGKQNYVVGISGNGDYIFLDPLCSQFDKGMLFYRLKNTLFFSYLEGVDLQRNSQCCKQFVFTHSGSILSIQCRSVYVLKFQCQTNCELCTFLASQCTKCKDSFVLDGANCICNSTEGKGIDHYGEKCIECAVQNCYACIDDNRCSVCLDGFTLYNSSCHCLGQANIFNQSCVPCLLPYCSICETIIVCYKCETGFRNQNGSCECDGEGMIVSPSTNECFNCSVDHCQNCDQNNSCSICQSGFTLTNFSCQCLGNSSVVSFFGLVSCVDCSVSNCISCLDAQMCLLCLSGFANINGFCQCVAPNSHIIQNSTQFCIPCFVQNCAKCELPNFCTECSNSNYGIAINSGTCYCRGYTDLDGNCVMCSIQNCQVCAANGKCIICKHNFSLVNEICSVQSVAVSDSLSKQMALIIGLWVAVTILLILLICLLIGLFCNRNKQQKSSEDEMQPQIQQAKKLEQKVENKSEAQNIEWQQIGDLRKRRKKRRSQILIQQETIESLDISDGPENQMNHFNNNFRTASSQLILVQEKRPPELDNDANFE